MARLALSAVGLALTAPSAWAGHHRATPPDQTGLFQMGRGGLEAESGGKTRQKSDDGYGFEEFEEGMLVETKMKNGTWVLAAIQSLQPGNVWDIKIPGQDLQGVPANLLRKRLDDGESDWLVVERFPGLFSSFGIPYFGSKNMEDSLDPPYALFNTYVVGKDEVDGWLKVSRGYLPMKLKGAQVLAKRERKQTVALTQELRDWYLEAEEDRRKTVLAKASLEPPPPQRYDVNEEALFQTSDGAWRPARVTSLDFTTYSVLVQPVGGAEYKVSKVHPNQLRKAGPPQHTPVKDEGPTCQNEGGCIDVRLKVASPGEEVQYHHVRAVMGMTIHWLRKSACEAIQNPKNCETRIEVSLHGRSLPPSWRLFETGIKDSGTVEVKLGPMSVTDVEEY